MALYTISDLHLPLGVDKPMDIFGARWENYVERIREQWQSKVAAEDLVILPGDFSWATYLEETKKDFEFLESLPGKKILLKGNHDYWWTTMSKMRRFVGENQYESVDFLQNDCVMYNDIAIAGSRGWSYIGKDMPTKKEDIEIYEREKIRLELSIEAAKKHNPKEIIVFMHYPPITVDCPENGFTEIFERHGIKKCVYGHIHGRQEKTAIKGEFKGVEYLLVSCDCVDFSPVKLCE